MPRPDIRRQALLEVLLQQAADELADTLLDAAADQEARICMLELGIN